MGGKSGGQQQQQQQQQLRLHEEELMRLKSIGKKAAIVRWLSSVVALVAGVVAVIVGVFSVDFSPRDLLTPPIPEEWRELRFAFESQQVQIKIIADLLADLTSLPDDAKVAMRLATMEVEIQQLNEQQAVINTAIGESTAKTISLPLIRQDIEFIKSRQDAVLADAREQIDRIYDQNKWFIGLMITIAIGVIGLAVGNLYQAGKKSP